MMGFGLPIGIGGNAATGGAVLLDGSESDGTNVLPGGNNFSTGWTGAGATLTTNTTVAPDGTTTAATLVESAATQRHIVYAQGSVTGQFTASLYMKQNTRRYCQLFIGDSGGTNSVYAVVDLTNGSVTDSGVVASGVLTSAVTAAAANGFYKVTIVGQVQAGLDSVYVQAVMSNRSTQSGLLETGNISYAGDGTSGFYIWRPKLVD